MPPVPLVPTSMHLKGQIKERDNEIRLATKEHLDDLLFSLPHGQRIYNFQFIPFFLSLGNASAI